MQNAETNKFGDETLQTKAIRIAILNCPGSRPFAPYFIKLFQDYQYLNESQGVQFDFSVFDVPSGELKTKLSSTSDILLFDVFLITGSSCSAYEDIPWIHDLKAFIVSVFELSSCTKLEIGHKNNFNKINEANTKTRSENFKINIGENTLAKKIKLLGICFGHQIIAQALGEYCGRGLCCKNPEGWTLGVDNCFINGEEANRYWKFLQDKLLARDDLESSTEHIENNLRLQMNYIHQDHIPSTPTMYNIKSLGNHPTAKHSYGFYNQSNLLTFQGHPEFDLDIMNNIISKLKEKGTISEKNVNLEKIEKSLHCSVNREALARGMIAFCLD